MGEIRKAFDALDFVVVETAKYTQFVRKADRGQVKIDLLAAPLGQYESRVKEDKRRVKPKPSVNLHASRMNAAVAVECDPIAQVGYGNVLKQVATNDRDLLLGGILLAVGHRELLGG